MSDCPAGDALYAEWLALHPIGRIGRTEEVAALSL
jgi:hypothetical protein